MGFSRRMLLGFAASLALFASQSAFPQQYPFKPVKILVPAGPGTSTDALTRFFAEGDWGVSNSFLKQTGERAETLEPDFETNICYSKFIAS